MNLYVLFLFFLTNLCLYSQTKGVSPLSTINQQLSTNTYAVVVGISDYQDNNIPDLRFADKDAEAFANFLRSSAGGRLDVDHLKVLLNEKATVAQFAIALDWLMEVVKENDQVIIYFSGHGDVEKKTITQPGYLLCWDAPSRVYLAGGALALPMFQDIITTLSAQNTAKVVVITDACRSGKLAGSSVGGSQITGANLAKQYSNEIKILSCQPNEYSIEGEQWGGGRGAFSYHLIDALYGMADNNNDLIVNLQEAGRYIEDHVSAEVAPVSQVPMVLGNRTDALSKVDPNLLASIKSGKSSQMGFLSSIDTRGMEEDVLALVDTSVRLTYKLFKQAIKDKIFLEPASACAEMYYNQLIKEPKLERLHSTLRRNYAAALMDEGQQAINDFVTGNVKAWEKMEEEIGFSNRKTADKFYRAAALLGEKHYLYSKVKAKALYFEAFTVYHLPISWDSANVLDIRLMKQAISLDPDSPILWYNLAFFVTTDSLDFYIDRLNELVPNWPVWNGMIGWRFEKINPERAVGFYQKAITLDSTYLKASNRLALLLDTIGRHEEATQYREKIVRIALRKVEKNVKSLAHEEWFSLLISLYRLNRGIETEKLIEQYIALDPKELLTYWTLAEMYSRLRHYKEGEQILKRYILLDPTNSNVYLSIAYFQTTQNHIDQAFGTLELAMKNGLNYSYYEGLQTDPEIAPLRERTEQWDALMKKYFPEKIK